MTVSSITSSGSVAAPAAAPVTRTAPPVQPAGWLVFAAFAATYLFWSGSYIAIRFAVESIPPFFMAGSRFIIAGALLILFTLWRGAARPTRRQWRSALIAGMWMFLLNNGALVWAAKLVPSGIAALLIASTPLWIVVIDWLRAGAKPSRMVVVGLVLGLFGIALLVNPAQFGAVGALNPVGTLTILWAALCWGIGTIYSRDADLPDNPLLSTGMQLFSGGVQLVVLSAVTGELAAFQPAHILPVSVAGYVYLIVCASLLGFSAFVWLLRVVPPARVATYAYVNPVLAVFLGWLLASEPISERTLVAAAVIVGAVVIINTHRHRPAPAA